jgi:dynein heavy chain
MQAFQAMAKGDRQAMAKYNELQVKQLTRLIEVTRTDLGKVRMDLWAWL